MRHWNEKKARKNLEKHGVSFEEAYTVFNDPFSSSESDGPHSWDEDRFMIIGRSDHKRLLVVTYVVFGDDLPWLIHARPAKPAEKRRFMAGDEIHDALLEPDDDECDDRDFDFSKAVPRKHYFPFLGIRVFLDPDTAEYFPTEEMVNDALRVLISEGRATKQPPPRTV